MSAWGRGRRGLTVSVVALGAALLASLAPQEDEAPTDAALAATLLRGVQHRSLLLRNVDLHFSYEYLESPNVLEARREELKEAGYSRAAEQREPYHRSIIRLTRFGEKWRGEVRDTTRSGHCIWDPEAFDWHNPPEAHNVYVLAIFDGTQYTRYSQAGNVVEITAERSDDWLPMEHWWEKCMQVISPRAMAAILDSPPENVHVERARERRHWELYAVHPSTAVDQPTGKCRVWIDQDLGYAVTKYVWAFERGGTPSSGSVVAASDFRMLAGEVFVPTRVEWHEYGYTEEGEPKWRLSRRYRLREAELLTEDHPSLFTFTPPLGVLVRTDTREERWWGEEVEAPFDTAQLQFLAPPAPEVADDLAELLGDD